MPRHDGVWGEPWDTCDRCGFEHPMSMLSKQNGLKLCTDHGCRDDLSNQYRQIQIQQTLASGDEGVSQTAEQFKDAGEIITF